MGSDTVYAAQPPMKDQETDRYIVRSRRDPGSFTALIAIYQTRIYSFLARMVGVQAAEDLFQEVWIQVYKASAKYNPQGKATSWIFKIAHKTARRYYQDLHAESAVGEGLEAGTTLRQAIDGLPVQERTVFLLREYAGMPFKEIAETLDIPLETGLSLMNAAIDKLREKLEPYRA